MATKNILDSYQVSLALGRRFHSIPSLPCPLPLVVG